MVGFCRIWIPGFGLIEKSLYKAIKGPNSEPLEWNHGLQNGTEALKQDLNEVLALGLHNLEKLFTLYVAGK